MQWKKSTHSQTVDFEPCSAQMVDFEFHSGGHQVDFELHSAPLYLKTEENSGMELKLRWPMEWNWYSRKCAGWFPFQGNDCLTEIEAVVVNTQEKKLVWQG